jgi:hypothetical protein
MNTYEMSHKIWVKRIGDEIGYIFTVLDISVRHLTSTSEYCIWLMTQSNNNRTYIITTPCDRQGTGKVYFDSIGMAIWLSLCPAIVMQLCNFKSKLLGCLVVPTWNQLLPNAELSAIVCQLEQSISDQIW